MREGVGLEEITEFVVDAGDRNVEPVESEEAESDDDEEYRDDGNVLAFCEIGEGAFDATEGFLAGPWEDDGQDSQGGRNFEGG